MSSEGSTVRESTIKNRRSSRRAWCRLCEKSEVQFGLRTSVSISSDLKTNSASNCRREKTTRKRFYAFSADATFHTAWVPSVAQCSLALRAVITKRCSDDRQNAVPQVLRGSIDQRPCSRCPRSRAGRPGRRLPCTHCASSSFAAMQSVISSVSSHCTRRRLGSNPSPSTTPVISELLLNRTAAPTGGER